MSEKSADVNLPTTHLFVDRNTCEEDSSCVSRLSPYKTSSPKITNEDGSSSHVNTSQVFVSPTHSQHMLMEEQFRLGLLKSKLSTEPSLTSRRSYNNEKLSMDYQEVVPEYITRSLVKNMHELITTSRLQPIREKMNRVIFSITKTGFTCLEFFKLKDGMEVIYEILWITPTGQQVSVSHPEPAQKLTLSNEPLYSSVNVQHYPHAELPVKYRKKYNYALRIINLIQSKTPKVTVYNTGAKCILMENADFHVFFYDGRRSCKTKTGIEVREQDGHHVILDATTARSHMKLPIQEILDYSNQCEKVSINLEAILCQAETKHRNTLFPVTIGRRPKVFCEAETELSNNEESVQELDLSWSQNTEELKISEDHSTDKLSDDLSCDNRLNTGSMLDDSNDSDVSFDSFDSHDGHGFKSATNHEQVPVQLCKVFIHGLGWGIQLSNGEVSVEYVDGDELLIQMYPMTVQYKDKQGRIQRFGEYDVLSPTVYNRLNTLPLIMEKLETAQLL